MRKKKWQKKREIEGWWYHITPFYTSGRMADDYLSHFQRVQKTNLSSIVRNGRVLGLCSLSCFTLPDIPKLNKPPPPPAPGSIFIFFLFFEILNADVSFFSFDSLSIFSANRTRARARFKIDVDYALSRKSEPGPKWLQLWQSCRVRITPFHFLTARFASSFVFLFFCFCSLFFVCCIWLVLLEGQVKTNQAERSQFERTGGGCRLWLSVRPYKVLTCVRHARIHCFQWRTFQRQNVKETTTTKGKCEMGKTSYENFQIKMFTKRMGLARLSE